MRILALITSMALVAMTALLLGWTLASASADKAAPAPVEQACDAYCQEVYSQPPWPGLKIQEDDPGWNCHTMGNRICGEGRG